MSSANPQIPPAQPAPPQGFRDEAGNYWKLENGVPIYLGATHYNPNTAAPSQTITEMHASLNRLYLQIETYKHDTATLNLLLEQIELETAALETALAQVNEEGERERRRRAELQEKAMAYANAQMMGSKERFMNTKRREDPIQEVTKDLNVYDSERDVDMDVRIRMRDSWFRAHKLFENNWRTFDLERLQNSFRLGLFTSKIGRSSEEQKGMLFEWWLSVQDLMEREGIEYEVAFQQTPRPDFTIDTYNGELPDGEKEAAEEEYKIFAGKIKMWKSGEKCCESHKEIEVEESSGSESGDTVYSPLNAPTGFTPPASSPHLILSVPAQVHPEPPNVLSDEELGKRWTVLQKETDEKKTAAGLTVDGNLNAEVNEEMRDKIARNFYRHEIAKMEDELKILNGEKVISYIGVGDFRDRGGKLCNSESCQKTCQDLRSQLYAANAALSAADEAFKSQTVLSEQRPTSSAEGLESASDLNARLMEANRIQTLNSPQIQLARNMIREAMRANEQRVADTLAQAEAERFRLAFRSAPSAGFGSSQMGGGYVRGEVGDGMEGMEDMDIIPERRTRNSRNISDRQTRDGNNRQVQQDQSREHSSGREKCIHCGRTNHTSADCTRRKNESRDRNLKVPSNSRAESNTGSGNSSRKSSQPGQYCSHCKMKNHSTEDCTRKPREEERDRSRGDRDHSNNGKGKGDKMDNSGNRDGNERDSSRPRKGNQKDNSRTRDGNARDTSRTGRENQKDSSRTREINDRDTSQNKKVTKSSSKPERKVCDNCGKLGHLAADCRNKSSEPPNKGKNRSQSENRSSGSAQPQTEQKCEKCKGRHGTGDCKRCQNCSEWGHEDMDCPEDL
ncbi:Retrovirus zinc finger-like protein [Glarea lozoyensis ATCC 20868]|uniref:Retrovirus zinc finger-like protein n=1 Tax=Glarea lozoyensis (strain ATCC 20868 / MF5171) TaxID=1116229 RepID=S3DRP6_GLAL2|nr:Retrovirus zinc finger-like protein [Glarea lozoyensis ATCC 20868]EPE29133.1 Retrovirus zinc finger-like protein [Glarea lozoyensis ATCC 20868]